MDKSVTLFKNYLDELQDLKDQGKECIHVDFAWSLPQMRNLIEEYIRQGKIKEAGRAE